MWPFPLKSPASFPVQQSWTAYAVTSGHKIVGLYVWFHSFFHDLVLPQYKVALIIAA